MIPESSNSVAPGAWYTSGPLGEVRAETHLLGSSSTREEARAEHGGDIECGRAVRSRWNASSIDPRRPFRAFRPLSRVGAHEPHLSTKDASDRARPHRAGVD